LLFWREAIPLSGAECGADLVGAEVSGEDDLWLRYLGHVPHLANQMFSYGCLVLKNENNIMSSQSKRYRERRQIFTKIITCSIRKFAKN
jgi:hypothetical protein